MKTLRTDQATGIAKVREAVGQGERRIVFQMPTGGGKTVISADMAERARAKNKRVLVTVPVLSLVDQTVEMLGEQGVRTVGVIQARHAMTDPTQPVQVASVQTLINRSIPAVDLVVIDEIHKWFKFYEKWLCDPVWQKVPVIGMSATPWTKGLGAYFQRLIVANTIKDMIEEGTLAQFKVFAPSHPDLEGVRTVAGDYHEGDLFERMKPPRLTADIVQSWKTHAAGRPTICFAVNRDHAQQLAKEFETAGVPAGYMDCETPVMQRMAIRTQLKTGRIQVVCNVDVIGLGVDWPEISCISYCRPTKSEMRYVQNIGRGLRAHKDKDCLLILDHSDTTLRLGFVSDIHHDELDDGKPRITAQKLIALPKECYKCHYIKPPKTAKCPNCGHIAEHQVKPTATAPGQLRELRHEDVYKEAPVARRLQSKVETYGQLLWYARKHEYKDGWASMQYRKIYGIGPFHLSKVEEKDFKAPEMALASWIKAQNIRWAKSQKRNRWNDEVVNGTHVNGHANGSGGSPAVGGRGSVTYDTEMPAGSAAPVAGSFIPGTLMTKDDLENF